MGRPRPDDGTALNRPLPDENGSLPGIRPQTIDAHRTHIREKLGLGDGNERIRFAVRWIESELAK